MWCHLLRASFSSSSAFPSIMKCRGSWKTRSHETQRRSFCTWTWLHQGAFLAGGRWGKLSASGCSSDRLYMGLQGDGWLAWHCYFNLLEGSRLYSLVFVKKHPWHCCLFSVGFRQAQFNKNSSLETQGKRQSPRKWGWNRFIPRLFNQIQLRLKPCQCLSARV